MIRFVITSQLTTNKSVVTEFINGLQSSILFLQPCNQQVIYELTKNLKIKKITQKDFWATKLKRFNKQKFKFNWTCIQKNYQKRRNITKKFN